MLTQIGGCPNGCSPECLLSLAHSSEQTVAHYHFNEASRPSVCFMALVDDCFGNGSVHLGCLPLETRGALVFVAVWRVGPNGVGGSMAWPVWWSQVIWYRFTGARICETTASSGKARNRAAHVSRPPDAPNGLTFRLVTTISIHNEHRYHSLEAHPPKGPRLYVATVRPAIVPPFTVPWSIPRGRPELAVDLGSAATEINLRCCPSAKVACHWPGHSAQRGRSHERRRSRMTATQSRNETSHHPLSTKVWSYTVRGEPAWENEVDTP